MRAVILAAGVGKRLAPAGLQHPKCLLHFGAMTLLHRHLDALRHVGVTDVTVVVGYRAGEVAAEIEGLRVHPKPVTVLNPDFERGSVLSLGSARDALRAGGDVLVMDADVLYDVAILERLVEREGNRFLLDREFDDAGGEAVKLCVRDGILVEFRKQLAPSLAYDFAGESVGFFRFSEPVARALAERCDAYARSGRMDEPYEEAIRDLLLAEPERFSFAEVTGLPWIEIDFPEDVERARREILPRLSPSPASRADAEPRVHE